ncbi:MAG: hypothetical protein ACREBR_02550 [bacterium]
MTPAAGDNSSGSSDTGSWGQQQWHQHHHRHQDHHDDLHSTITKMNKFLRLFLVVCYRLLLKP